MKRLLPLLAMGLIACVDLTAEPPSRQPGCVSDRDCGENQVCDPDARSCVALSLAEALEVVLEVVGRTLPGQTAQPPLVLDGRTITEGVSELELELPGTTRVRGTVRVFEELRDEETGDAVIVEEVVGATVRFVLEDEELPSGVTGNRAITVETTRRSDVDVDFEADLLAGASYTIEVEPNASPDDEGTPWSRRLPPLRIEGLELPARDGSVIDLARSFDYPFEELACDDGNDVTGDGCDKLSCGPGRTGGCRLTGRVVSEDEEGARTPVANVSVRAIEAEGGALVSSLAITDDEGRFVLTTSPGARPYLIRLSASEDRPTQATTLVDPAFFPAGEELTILAPRHQLLNFQGVVRLHDAMPGEGANVELVSTSLVDLTGGPPSSFAPVPVSVGRDGRFSIDILAGTYDVTITPPAGPAGAGSAVLVERLVLAPEDGSAELCCQGFDLGPRLRFSGFVNSDGVLFGSAVNVRATRRPPGEGAPLVALAARDGETTTQGGAFVLPLDVGSFDVVVLTPAAAGRPWQILPDLYVDVPLDRDIELGATARIDGQVLGAGGAECLPALDGVEPPPCVGAEVRAFVRLPGRDRFVLLGQAVTDATGAFALLLPASLPAEPGGG